MNDTSCATLVARSVTYGSQNDERAFFEWLGRIEGVERIEGIDRQVHIHVSRGIAEHGLRDLVAVFFRYGIDLTQIPKVFSVDAHPWLLKDTAFWFRAMFPERL